ncbi:GspH/FimT family pseudopilin [Wenzhouxiangella sp. EGI_FJ10409]|uniref:GspH/FimT family pseudopilin n=1 Tax=Wenzhouxiangella sp. EGI_FJ10409 TaxID=3243767 RepID=UPI0035DC0EBF
MKYQSNRGFTVLELMITVTVLVILATVALPNMRSTIQNNRMTAQVNGFLTAFQLARSEAVKRGEPVSICASDDSSSCSGSWEDGWIVFVDGNAVGSSSASVDTVLQVWDGFDGDATHTGDEPDFLRYVGSGTMDRDAGISLPVTFDIEIADCTADNNRRLVISATGSADVRRRACN